MEASQLDYFTPSHDFLGLTDLRTNLEVILPMREEVPRRGEASDAAACCDRLGEAGGPL